MGTRVVFVPAPRLPAPAPAPVPPGFRGKLPEPPFDPEVARAASPEPARVDGARLAANLAQTIADLEAEGLEVRQVLPISSGAHGALHALHKDYQGQYSAGYGAGYGYSFTEGVLVVAG